jgi:predicted phage tail protein
MADSSETTSEKSVPELIKQITAQSAALARKELELAEAELTIKGKRAGIGAGMLGSAGVLSLFGVGCLAAAAIIALHLVMPSWAAALIVAGAFLGTAGFAAVFGGISVKRATPLAPSEAAASVKDDVEVIKAHAERGRQ